MPQIGPLEILVIFIVALVVFGPSKLPQIGRQVGRGVREFRKFQSSVREDIEGAFHDEDDHEVDDARVEGEQPKQLETGNTDPAKPEPAKPDPGGNSGPTSSGQPKPDPAKPDAAKSSDPAKPTEPPPADATP